MNLKPTDYLAIYGAFLSTVVFLWNYRKALPSIKVDIAYAVVELIDEVDHGIYIVVRNVSSQTVHLSNIDMLFPSRKVTFFDKIKFIIKYRRAPRTLGWIHSSLSNYNLDSGCPISVDAGNSHKVFVPEKVLKSNFRRKYRASYYGLRARSDMER